MSFKFYSLARDGNAKRSHNKRHSFISMTEELQTESLFLVAAAKSVEKNEHGFYFLPKLSENLNQTTVTRFNEFATKQTSPVSKHNKHTRKTLHNNTQLVPLVDDSHKIPINAQFSPNFNQSPNKKSPALPTTTEIEDRELIAIRRLEGLSSPRSKENNREHDQPMPHNSIYHYFPKTPQEKFINSKHYNNKYFHQYIDVKIPSPAQTNNSIMSLSLEDGSGYVSLEDFSLENSLSATHSLDHSNERLHHNRRDKNSLPSDHNIVSSYMNVLSLNMDSLTNDSVASVSGGGGGLQPLSSRENNVLYDHKNFVVPGAAPPKSSSKGPSPNKINRSRIKNSPR